MKKWILGTLAALIVGYAGLLPFESADAGELYVVETLLVEADESGIRLCSGAVTGSGTTAAEAVVHMEQNTPGQLFLRQTKRVIFCGGAEKRLDVRSLPEELPMGAAVYTAQQPAMALAEEQEQLEKILEARERRQTVPTLANLENAAAEHQALELAPLEQEETGE